MSRTKPQPLPAFKPCLLLGKWKDGTQYFNCPTEAHLFSACLSVLKLKVEAGYFSKPQPRAPEHPGISLAEAESLAEGPIRKAALETWQKYEASLRSNESYQIEYDEVMYAIEYDDGALAFHILRNPGYIQTERVSDCDPLPKPESPPHQHRYSDPETGERWIYDKTRGWIRRDYARMVYNQQVADGEEPRRVE